MIKYLIDNKEWIFSGIGVAILSWLIVRNINKIKMIQKSGDKSINIQAGRDLTFSKRKEKNGNK